MRLLRICIALSVSGALSCGSLGDLPGPEPGRAPQGPVPRRWVRIRHPEIPISFDVPETAERKHAYHSLGGLDEPPHPPRRVLKFGVRSVSVGDGVLYAVEVCFFWLTVRNAGVDEALLLRLAMQRADAAAARELYRRAFLEHRPTVSIPEVRFRDLGAVTWAGRSGRRLAAERRVNWRVEGNRILSCEDCPYGDYEIWIAPLGTRAALVAFGRFLAETPEERNGLFRRIVSSVRIEGPIP